MRSGGFAVVLCVCGSACGDVKDGNQPADAPAGDTPLVDASDVDAPPPRCDPSKPFGTPVAVTEINSPGEEGPAFLSPDELTITFSSSRSGGVGGPDAYLATRASPTDAFGTPALIAGVNTTTPDNRPMMTADGLFLYFETNLTNMAADWQIAVATRTSTSASFGAWVAVPQLNSAVADGAPYVLPDHSAIYFTSNRSASGAHELWRATRTGGNWTTPAVVTGTNLNDATLDYPFLTADELTLYFASSRTGGAGGRDIWVATRASLVTGFGDPVNVAALNSTATETGGWVSADNCVIYFLRSAAVGGGAGNPNIFRATKPL